jgi:hypothetical protein
METYPRPLVSTATFVLDPGSQELGDPQRNIPGKPTPRRKITNQHFGRCLITGYLQGWYRGTAAGRPASLLLLDFRFTFTKKRKYRYTFGEIKLSIEDSPTVEPDVVDMYPRDINGVGKSTSEFGDKTPSTESFRLYTAKQTDTQNPERDNVCRWLIDESPDKGIPDFLPCAVVIAENGKPFKVAIEVRVTASLAFVADPGSWGLYAHLWKDEPLVFTDGAETGRFPALPVTFPNMDWSRLSEEQWQILVPFPRMSEVSPSNPFLICRTKYRNKQRTQLNWEEAPCEWLVSTNYL